uniref:Uncharacterized protein n=1 Tax=Globodera rostochiensis TaxID=31243 RepID=A0A914HVH1_GLORO
MRVSVIFIFLIHHVNLQRFCGESLDCVSKIRRMARETNRFWFGDQWTMNCGWHIQQKRERIARGNPIACANPPSLSPFTSLGSRLFRVHTFTNAYLANLRVFPLIHFEAQSGHYRACGHNFDVPPPSKNELLRGHTAHPLSRPLPTFQAQKAPDIGWTELHPNQSLIVAMVDVGFGQLNYLAVDFPRDTQIIRPYRIVDNFRPRQPTPLAVLIFEAPKDAINATIGRIRAKYTKKDEENAMFDLGQFMIDNGLEKGLIGLNWALIDGDAFGIERMRLRGRPDNCHSLILQKLLRDRRWHFVETFPLSAELDSSLSISLVQPASSLHVCCFSNSVLEEQLYLDPLADLQLPSNSFRHGNPSVNSILALNLTPDSLYQRSSRHYLVSSEERFALVLFDPSRLLLFWMVVDIPSEGLTAGGALGGVEVAKYVAPIPTQPGDCTFAVFMLFRQPTERTDGRSEMGDFFNSDHPIRQRQCHGHCSHREDFDIEQFKALHRLYLSAISWAKVCFDLFEASHQISLIRKSPEIREGVDRTSKLNRAAWGGGQSKKDASTAKLGDPNWKLQRQHQIAAICSYFNRTTAASSSSSAAADHLRISSLMMTNSKREEFCVPIDRIDRSLIKYINLSIKSVELSAST